MAGHNRLVDPADAPFMRAWFPVALMIALAAGCVDEPTSREVQEVAAGADTVGQQALPEDIDHEEQVLATVGYSRSFEFELEHNATLDAVLRWNLAAHDFDLYLYRGDTAVAWSIGMTSVEEIITERLTPGSYSLVINVFSRVITTDTYHLQATFTPA